GSFGSFMAMNMQMITRSWLVVRMMDDSPLALSLSIVSFTAPIIVVSLFAGALADTVSRRQLVIWSQSGNALMTLLLATLDATGVIAFWHVMAIGLANGSLMAFNGPSRQAILSDIVPEGRLMNAISLNNSSMNLTRVLGPAMAGFLILLVDTSGVFFIVSAVYVFSIVTMVKVRAGSEPASRSGKGMAGDIREGLSYVASDRTLLGLVIMMFIPALFGYSYFALLPAWAREALDVQSDGLGILMMLMGIGALVGTLILASMGNFSRRGALLLVFCLLWGMILAVFAQTETYAQAVPLLMLMGLVSSVYMSLNMTLVQIYAAPEMRGRVMSISMMSFGVMPLSGVPFGILAEFTDTAFALMLSGILLVVFTLIFTAAYPSFRRVA
ncbi:MAG: MFS transporter, partial [Chloroflexi bacterium]|nr:MFS transporter [Chloroflexota bacterium]